MDFTFFDTPIGACALVWGARGLVGALLPESTQAATRARIGRRFPLHRRVYAIARAIPPGATLTYGEVAGRLGEPHASRAVGQALGANPFPIVVPCHRVLAAGGKAGGFSAEGGIRTKLRLLQIEGAVFGGAPGLF